MDLFTAMEVSSSGMQAQGRRLRVIAENIANRDSLADSPGLDPYRRRMVTFRSVLDEATGASKVEVDRVVPDRSEFALRFDPQHPAADENGYVKIPNVNTLVEMMDMREAQRSYEANMNVVEAAKTMLRRTIELLRN
ncbi:MAG: flagellar basal body rod protein FlgC [Alphaproteobacteria bacterium]